MKVRLQNGELVRGFQTQDVGGHGVVTGKVRVATAEEVERWQADELPRLTRQYGTAARAHADLYARHITEWDLEGPDGKVLPIDAATVARVPTAVQSQFRDIVTGYTADPFSGRSPASPG